MLDELKKLALDTAAVDVLWLYGSRAKGNHQPDSDYDLAVAFNHFPDDAWDKRLQPEMLALEWADALGLATDRLSVADINHIPLPLAYAIISTGKPLLVKNALRLAREENRVTSMWELDHEYHKRRFG